MVRYALAALGLFWLGCGDDGSSGGTTPDATPPGDLPTAPPTAVRKVVGAGFQTPTDAVASPDGKTFFFAALTMESPPQPALFKVSAAGGAAQQLAAGPPFELITGLVMSCDGHTLYVADGGDSGGEDADGGALYTVSEDGGAPQRLSAPGIAVPSGLAMGPDCNTLYVSGHADDGRGALYSVATTGGTPKTILAGAPLVNPTGLHVDAMGVSWVMDHSAGEGGSGALFAIDGDGKSTLRADRLSLGTPGGVSLTAGGGNAVLSTGDRETGTGALIAVDLATNAITSIPSGDIAGPAGLRTARGAGVFAVADSEGDAIFAAE